MAIKQKSSAMQSEWNPSGFFPEGGPYKYIYIYMNVKFVRKPEGAAVENVFFLSRKFKS